MATQAALTGHLVFSTLHTNSAAGILPRLLDMGIEPFLINAAIHGVLAQRLVRMVCTACRAYRTPTDQEKQLLIKLGADAIDQLAHGSGCATCLHTGYKGRMGIFEFMPINAMLRSYIVQHPSYDVLHHQAQADGMKPLIYDGLMKVRDGVTTVAELVRVVY